MSEMTAGGMKLKLADSDCSVTVRLGDKYVLKNGLTATAHFWDTKDDQPSVAMVLIPEDRYQSGRGLEVLAFNCGDGDVFGPAPGDTKGTWLG